MKKIPNHEQKTALAIAIAAGVSGMTVADDASAVTVAATLSSILTYSNNGTAVLNFSSSTGLSWSYDDATNLMTQTGGTLNARATTAPTSTLFRHLITGLVIGNGGAGAASSFVCEEGNFGGGVGSSICGNYNMGANFANESTTTWSGTTATRTLGGDDFSIGPVQSITSQYSGFSTVSWVGTTLILQNATCTGGCLTNPPGSFNGGYTYTFNAVAAAVAAAVDDDGGNVLQGVAKNINVGANDTAFTDPVTITRTTPNPTKGTAVVNIGTGNAADVTITYTADAGQTGTDTFGYQITDGIATETATVTVNILAFGANDDSASTTRGVALTGLTPAANDTGYDPDTVTLVPGACSSGDGVIAVTDGNGGPKAGVLVTYTPPANNPASGSGTTLTDTCSYTIGNGDEPDTTADIVVTVTNSVPVANDGTITISSAGVAPVGLTGTFTSPGTGGSLGNAGVTAVGAGTNGTTSVAGNVITYTVDTAFVGSNTFTYTVTDADGAASDETATGTVTVTIANVAPTIADRTITTDVDTVSTGNTLTITAGNGSPTQHTLAVTTDGAHGNCTLSAANATGTLTYTPDAGYAGDDECVLTLTDLDGQPDTATIDITVNAEDEITLPGGSSSMDLWSLSLLGSLPLLMRRRRRS